MVRKLPIDRVAIVTCQSHGESTRQEQKDLEKRIMAHFVGMQQRMQTTKDKVQWRNALPAMRQSQSRMCVQYELLQCLQGLARIQRDVGTDFCVTRSSL
jgi:hypothetical protein